MQKTLLTIVALTLTLFSFGQRGKDGDLTVSSLNKVVNTYAKVTQSIPYNSTATIYVDDNKMNGADFAGDLGPGDLVLIYQVQGVTADIDDWSVIDWGGTYVAQNSFFEVGGPSEGIPNFIEFGNVVHYYASGFYEYKEVKSVSGTNEITFTCNVSKYFYAGADDNCQVIRVPRYNSLTVPSGTSITATSWNGNTGGVVAVEVLNDLTVNGTGKIHADKKGFRGGATVNNGTMVAPGNNGSIASIGSRGYLGSYDPNEGAGKGESIFTNLDGWSARYGYGSLANGGGGGGYHNAGGGGGSNVGVGDYFGYGIVDRGPSNSYDPAWNLESPTMISQPSAGGGRGGYSHVEADRNPLTTGPHNTSWGRDYRRISGGVGGHPLDFDVERVFFGGGGGGGHGNDGYGGAGGRGGGTVLITVYGEVLGDGTISANGENGKDAEGSQPISLANAVTGADGAGGGGGGGAIKILNVNPLPASLKIHAKGGNGGSQIIKKGGLYFGKQAQGPGGGGAGGMIAYASGSPVQDVSGGVNGTTNAGTALGMQMSSFPPNGATGGSAGMQSQPSEYFSIIVENDTICSGTSTTLTANVSGAYSNLIRWYTTPYGSVYAGSGTSFNTPPLTTDITYYVGNCQAPFRVPVTVVVSPPINIAGTAVATLETCFGNDGTITGLSASGGIGNLTYSWNGVSTPDANLANAANGSYTLTVTDEAGCSKTSGPHLINLTPNPVLDATNVVIQDETCDGNDGKVIGITVSGGTGPYVYKWDGVVTPTINLTDGVGGDRYLEVTDANGCSATAGPFTIAASPGPAISITNLVIENESCHGNDGSITGITASGGTGILTYSWSSGQTTTDITSLTAGTYTLTVTDQGGCVSQSGPHTIGYVPAASIDETNVLVSASTCGDDNGSISGLVVNGGTAPLTYSWNGNPSADEDLSAAEPGTYTLTITDAKGCVSTSSGFEILDEVGPSLDISAIVIADEDCGQVDGSITGITMSDGTGPFTYTWNGNSSASLDLTGQTGGSFTLVVEDFNGCTDTAGPFTIVGSTNPVLDESNVVLVDESCNGDDGSITGIEVVDGEAPYTYEWNGVTTTTIDLEDVVGGTYALVVTDANGCTVASNSYTLTSSPGPAIDVTNISIANETCHENDGGITGLSVSGGDSPYVFVWNTTPSASADLSNAEAGSYTLSVADVNGCVATAGPFVVGTEPAIVIDETNLVIVNESCHENDGEITGINVTGGVGALTYSWTNGAGSNVDANNLVAGTYTLTVTDNIGCELTSGPHTIAFVGGPSIDDANIQLTNETCGNSNGSIIGIAIVDGQTPYTYSWTNGAGSNVNANNLVAGTYTLEVTDANGCSVTSAAYTITNVAGPTIDETALVVNNQTCDGIDGSISGIVVSANTANYTVSWNGELSNGLDIEELAGGNYVLVVTDENGCTATTTVTVNGSIIPEVTITTPDQEIVLGESVVINSTTSNGVGSLWSPDDNVDCPTCPDMTATPEESTWYVITVTSADGCQAQDSIYIKVTDPCHDALFPTIFSPNGDGLNDNFCVIGGCLKSMELIIYNRWGEVMFRTNDVNECWDGTFKGELVNTGTYIYRFNGVTIDGKDLKDSGNINLIR